MRVKVSKREFLAQLPDKIRTDLVGVHDLPDYFEFNVEEIKEKIDAVGTMIENGEYSEVQKHLTAGEFYMFCVLVSSHPKSATINILSSKIRGERFNLSNTVAVHIKNMRKKFARHNLPFDIENSRAGVLGRGTYALIKK